MFTVKVTGQDIKTSKQGLTTSVYRESVLEEIQTESNTLATQVMDSTKTENEAIQVGLQIADEFSRSSLNELLVKQTHNINKTMLAVKSLQGKAIAPVVHQFEVYQQQYEGFAESMRKEIKYTQEYIEDTTYSDDQKKFARKKLVEYKIAQGMYQKASDNAKEIIKSINIDNIVKLADTISENINTAGVYTFKYGDKEIKSKGKEQGYKDFKAFARNWLRKNKQEGKLPKIQKSTPYTTFEYREDEDAKPRDMTKLNEMKAKLFGIRE